MGKLKVTISDSTLGHREIDTNGYLPILIDQHRLLCSWRDDGRAVKQNLLDDIAVYEYIIANPEAEKRAGEYMHLINELRRKDPLVKKMKVAKLLGWFK